MTMTMLALVLALIAATSALPTFQVFDDAAGQLRWRLRAGNGEIVLHSEGYTTPGAVTAGIDAVRRNAPMATRFTIMNATNGEFYLVLKGGNNEIIASGETYKTLQGAQNGIVAAQTAAANANRIDKSAAAVTDDNAGTFELFNDNAGEVRFRLVGQNGETILSSEGYASLSGALNGIDSVTEHAKDYSNYVYKTASNGQYYFTLNADNNQVIGVSELYKSLGGRAVGQYAVETASQGASIVDLRVAQPPTPKPAQFNLLQDALTGQFSFNLIDPKGRELLTADTLYVSKQGAMGGINSTMANAPTLAQYNNQSLDDGTLYFVLRAGNNQPLGIGPNSKTAADRFSNILDVQKYAPIAIVVDQTTAKTRMARFEIYRDLPTGLEYYWRLKSSNGQVILESPAAMSSDTAANAQITLVKSRATAVANYKNTTGPPAFSFVLTDAGGLTIGKSQDYSRADPRDAGLASVVNNAPNATIVVVPWTAPQTLMPTPPPTPSPTPVAGSACATYQVCTQCASVSDAADGPCHWCASSATSTVGTCSATTAACASGTIEVVGATGVCPTDAPTPEPTLAPTPSPLVDTASVVTQTPGASIDQQTSSTNGADSIAVASAAALVAVAIAI